jgi:hypothetical protein
VIAGLPGGVRHAMDVAGGHCHQLALAVHVGDGGVAEDEALLADGTGNDGDQPAGSAVVMEAGVMPPRPAHQP